MTDRPTLTPRNWGEFQHYKDRSPVWIKLHRKILDDAQFQRLPVASRALAPMLWLLASEYESGSIDLPADDFPGDIAWRLRWVEADLVDALIPLIQKGFFSANQSAIDVLARRYPNACLETEREKEKKKEGEKREKQSQPLPAAGAAAPAASDPPPPAEPTKGASNRGKRLSADWVLPKAWGDWALEQRPQWDAEHVREVAMRFRNHWVAKSGKDATKLDWLATWQNWVLKEPHHMPGRPTASAAPAPGMEHLGPAGRATAEAAARFEARLMAEQAAKTPQSSTEASHADA